jgi:hypothetical protein
MKIALIYTPRSGSTSILKYFQKVMPNFKCYNEPWFEWMQQNLYNEDINYQKIISIDNVFIKSAYKTLPVSLEQINKDFDKLIFLLRRNKKEQVESAVLLSRQNDFLNYSKRKYWVESIEEEEKQIIEDRYHFLNETLTKFAIDNDKKIFYYEDLYYDSFDDFFNEMELPFNEEAFDEFLNKKHRYREDVEIETKKNKTLL